MELTPLGPRIGNSAGLLHFMDRARSNVAEKFDDSHAFLYILAISRSRGLFIAYVTLTIQRTLRGRQTPQEGCKRKTGNGGRY